MRYLHQYSETGHGGPLLESLVHTILPHGNITCTDFYEYRYMPEMVLLYFTEDDVTWVLSKLAGFTGMLGVEAIDLRNLTIHFVRSLEGLRVVVDELDDWMDNSSSPEALISH